MNNIPLLIFDLDGTLVDSLADIKHCLNVALQRINVPLTEDLFRSCHRGISLEMLYCEATNNDYLSPSEQDSFDLFIDTYRQEYLTHHGTTALYPDVQDTLTLLRTKLPKTCFALATAKQTDMAHRVLEQNNILQHFDIVMGSDNIASKPDPAILFEIQNKTNIDITQALMVGDTDRDILAAHAAHCRSCGVTYSSWTREDFIELGDNQPTYIIDQFSEIINLFD